MSEVMVAPGRGARALSDARWEPWDSVLLVQCVLRGVAAGGADPVRIGKEAGLPGGVMGDRRAVVPSRYSLRLWEVAERALGDACLPLAIAEGHQVGELGLYDYLFMSAATLRDGLAVAGDFLHLVTTNGGLKARPGGDGHRTYAYQAVGPGGRGQELLAWYWAALLCVRARAATGRRVIPVRVSLPGAAPGSLRPFAEVFGTCQVRFGAPAASLTFAPGDLCAPMVGADAVLAGILRGYAPPPRSAAAVSFLDAFHRDLAEVIAQGAPSLREVARRMSVSSRTVQRRLGEHGTCWRAELDAVRRAIASGSGAMKMASLTRQLGYADTRSLRRAQRRWNDSGTLRDTPAKGQP